MMKTVLMMTGFCDYIDQDDKYDDNADDDYCSSHHEVDGVFAEVLGDVGEDRHLTNRHSLRSETNQLFLQSSVCLNEMNSLSTL